MKCNQCQILISDYIDGLLDVDERSQVERHLIDCTHCRIVHDDLLKVINHSKSLPLGTRSLKLRKTLSESESLGRREKSRKFLRSGLIVFAVLFVSSISSIILIHYLEKRGLLQSTRDGDPPEYELVSRNIQEIIDEEIKKLPPGKILFSLPTEMNLKQPQKVEIRISKSFKGDLVAGISEKEIAKAEGISVGSYMGLSLNGTEGFFSIDLKNRQEKIIKDNQYTEWFFDVTPLKAGTPSLYLTAYVVIDTPAGPRTYEHPTFVREITINANKIDTVLTFISNNWDKLIGIVISTGVVGLLAGWIAKKRKVISKEPPSWERL